MFFRLGWLAPPGPLHAQPPPSEKAFGLYHKLLSDMPKVKCDSKHWLHTAAFTQAKLQQKQTHLLWGKEKGKEELISWLFSI